MNCHEKIEMQQHPDFVQRQVINPNEKVSKKNNLFVAIFWSAYEHLKINIRPLVVVDRHPVCKTDRSKLNKWDKPTLLQIKAFVFQKSKAKYLYTTYLFLHICVLTEAFPDCTLGWYWLGGPAAELPVQIFRSSSRPLPDSSWTSLSGQFLFSCMQSLICLTIKCC